MIARASMKAMNNIQATDWAYAAGFFEGEGHICIRKPKQDRRSPSYRLEVEISNTDPIPIQWLQETFGGTTRVVEKGGRNRPLHHWKLIQAGNLTAFLGGIFPYLKFKERQVAIGLTFRTTVDPMRHKPLSEEEVELRERLRLSLRGLTATGIRDAA